MWLKTYKSIEKISNYETAYQVQGLRIVDSINVYKVFDFFREKIFP